jgi:hypothetical protein
VTPSSANTIQRTLAQRLAVLVTLPVMLLVVTVACGSHATPKPAVIDIGTPQPVAAKIALPGPYPCTVWDCSDQPASNRTCGGYDDCADHYGEPERWPQACDLITVAQLHTLLPQATKLTMTRHDIKVSGATGYTSEDTAKGADCAIDFTLPATGVREQDNHWNIDLTVDAAGGPNAVRNNYQTDLATAKTTASHTDEHEVLVERGDLGPTACFGLAPSPSAAKAAYQPDPSFTCYRGTLEFRVEGPWPESWPTSHVKFRHDGQLTTIADPASAHQFLSTVATSILIGCVNALI